MKYFTWLKRDDIVISKKELKELITADRDAHAAEERKFLLGDALDRIYKGYVETQRANRLHKGDMPIAHTLQTIEDNLTQHWNNRLNHSFDEEHKDIIKREVKEYSYITVRRQTEEHLDSAEFVTKLAKKLNDLQLKAGN